MRIHVVSDVHGRVDALAKAGDGADALICLGDLILFVDYADHGQGIFAELFGAENAGTFISLRPQRRVDEARRSSPRGRVAGARRLSQGMGSSLRGDAGPHVEGPARRQYAALFAAMPVPAYLTH